MRDLGSGVMSQPHRRRGGGAGVGYFQAVLLLVILAGGCADGVIVNVTLKAWGTSVQADLNKQWGRLGNATLFAASSVSEYSPNSAAERVDVMQDILHQWFYTAGRVVQNLAEVANRSIKSGEFAQTYWESEGFDSTEMPGILAKTPVFDPLPESQYRYAVDVANTSSVRISTRAKRHSALVQDFIKWSERIEPDFRANHDKYTPFLFQYVSAADTLRQFPGSQWPRDHMGAPLSYNVDERPWFRAVASGATDTVIVLDTSSSMAPTWSVALDVVRRVILTMTPRDSFAVVAADGSYTGWRQDRYERQTRVLGCRPTLSKGSSSSRREMLEEVSDIVPRGKANLTAALERAAALLRGGQPCAQSIVVVSNPPGERDPDAYCGIGSYSNNGAWLPGEVCEPETRDTVLPDSLKRFRGKVFQYVVSSQPVDLAEFEEGVVPGLGCATEYRRIGSSGAVRSSLSNYHSWKRAQTLTPKSRTSADDGDTAWSSPYRDALGTEMIIITLSKPFHYEGVIEGAVGVDFPMDYARAVLGMRDEGAYAFLINPNGEALVHPYARKTSDIFFGIEELEMGSDGSGAMQPVEFFEVRKALLGQAQGEVTVAAGARRVFRGSRDVDGFDIRFAPKKYVWRRVFGGFVVCVVYHPGLSNETAPIPSDVTFTSAALTPPVVYHRVDLYKAGGQSINVDVVVDQNSTTGRHVARNGVGFYVTPHCYCVPELHLSSAPLTLAQAEDINAYFRGSKPAAKCRSEDTDPYKVDPKCYDDLRDAAIHVTNKGWLPFTTATPIAVNAFTDVATVRYVTQMRNMLEVPAGPHAKGYVPHEEPWYLRAVHSPNITHVDVPRRNPLTGRLTITTSRAVLQGHDTQTNTSCTSDADCNSPAMCVGPEPRSCSSHHIEGVLSTEISLSSWKARLTPRDLDCRNATTYTCYHNDKGVNTSFTCRSLCFFVNSAGIVVYNSSAAWPQVNASLAVPLGSVHGEVMRQLVHIKKLFKRTERPRRDGSCRSSNAGQTLFSRETAEATDYDGNLPYRERNGKMGYADVNPQACSVMQSYYTLDLSKKAVQAGVLADGCSFGEYAAQVIEDTNLVSVVLRNYYSRIDDRVDPGARPLPRDFGCIMKNAMEVTKTRAVPGLPCTTEAGKVEVDTFTSDTCVSYPDPLCSS
eukprot:TRINITY_DN13583_c0_g1_i1.p1 TRINITY_DN13583_c0_g1~~TRINITY_DN13583_c0_g1_i1.p1  ORF type:complete len:1158 (+),score=301.73 TRINITY_DN13583_c0_g1_i1:347-3820(+)